MVRSQWESELFNLEFPSFTAAVRLSIRKLMSIHKCSELDDIVIDGIWSLHSSDLAAVVRPANSRTLADAAAEASNEVVLTAQEKLRAYVDRAFDHEAYLAELGDEALEKLYYEKFKTIEQVRRARWLERAQNNDRWDFFNTPEAEADFERWRSRFLSPAQAVALALSKNPDVVNPESLRPYRRIGGSVFREKFAEMLNVVESAVGVGDLSNPTTVGAFIEWAATRHLRLPPEFLKLARPEINEEVEHWKSRCHELENVISGLRLQFSDLPHKSKTSIYRLILGMAVARFEHTTGARSDGTKAIKGDLEDVGLALGPDAIRDWLREAALHLDYKRDEPIRWTGVRRRIPS